MIGYEQVVKRIELEGGLRREEIEARVGKKLEQLGDLISREGAAHIVAHELGIKVYDGLQRRMKIGELVGGISSVDVLGKIIAVYGVREFVKKNAATSGARGKVGSFLIGDATGQARVAVWDDGLLEGFSRLQVDGVVEVQQAVVKERNGGNELHLGRGGKIVYDVEEQIEVLPYQPRMREREQKKIAEVAVGDSAAVAGYIVQVFEPRFYEGCGECGRKIMGRCEEHPDAGSKKMPVVNFILDDGSGNIRIVAFRDVAASILGENAGDIGMLREGMMGRFVCVDGRVVRNAVFGKEEMIASSLVDVEASDVVGGILAD